MPRTLESLPGPNPAHKSRSRGTGSCTPNPAGGGQLAARDLAARDSNPPALGRGLEGRSSGDWPGGGACGLRAEGERDGGVARQAGEGFDWLEARRGRGHGRQAAGGAGGGGSPGFEPCT